MTPLSLPQFSIIVPHHNDLESLATCLAALERQTLGRESYEIIVADNASPIAREKLEAAVAGRARLVNAPIPGAGPARNAGVAASCGTFLAFTDCDCIPEPHWLEHGLEALSECDFAGGQMTVLIEGDRPGSGAEAFELVFAFDNRRYVLEQAFTVTANLFCARAMFDKVGPFKVGVSEDKEWCLRARSLGFRIGYAANAVVAHPARRNWIELRKKWDRMTRESYMLWRDQGRGTARWMIRTWGLLPSILVHGIRIARAPELKGFKERGMAFSTLTRSRLHRFVLGHVLVWPLRQGQA